MIKQAFAFHFHDVLRSYFFYIVICKMNGVSVNSGQVEPGISYDTIFEVAPSTRFILYHILERACKGPDPLRGHLNSGCLGA